MTQKQEENIEHSKSHEKQKKNSINENAILNILVFILILNQFNTKGSFSNADNIWEKDDYTVTMRENPAFPLEEEHMKKRNKPILNVENQKDLYSMFNTLKPHMNEKNSKIISIFEKYQALMEDLNDLSNNTTDEKHLLDLSRNEQKDIISFLYDIKPFIQPEYHTPIQQFADKINNILDIQKNINNLQSTFTHIHSISDDTKKINKLVDALQPFMDDSQKKTIDQLKNISQVFEMMKMTENFSQNTSQSENSSTDEKDSTLKTQSQDQENKNAQLLEILDILDPPPSDKNTEKSHPKDPTKQIADKKAEQVEMQEPKYEEIFEENIDFEGDC